MDENSVQHERRESGDGTSRVIFARAIDIGSSMPRFIAAEEQSRIVADVVAPSTNPC